MRKLSLKLTLFIITIFASANSYAMTYANEDALTEALARGKSEPFAQSVGFIHAVLTDGASQTLNGTLINSQYVIGTAHGFREKKIISAIFSTYHSVSRMTELSSVPRSEEFLQAQRISAKLDPSFVFIHPTADIAIFKLTQPLPVKSAEILYKRDWSVGGVIPGFLVSYESPSYIGMHCTSESYIRHVSVNHGAYASERIDLLNGHQVLDRVETPWSYHGNLYDSPEYSFPKDHHRLLAVTGPGDSGAAFIGKLGGRFYLLGINKGKIQLNGDKEEKKIRSVILLLFPYQDWIQRVISSSATTPSKF